MNFSESAGGNAGKQKLPAAATLIGAEKNSPRKVLIFQAEIDAKGKVMYGIVGAGILRAASSAELADVKPLQ